MNRRGFLAFLIAAPVTKALPWAGIAKALAPIAPQASAAIELTLADIITQTIRARMPELVANITAGNALLARLKEKEETKYSVDSNGNSGGYGGDPSPW